MATGTVKTVLGPIDPIGLGKTFTHEHVSMVYHLCYKPQQGPNWSQLPWSLENVGWIQQYPYAHADNVILNDAASEAAVLSSVASFKSSGGGCLVENSTFGLKRKTSFLKRLSSETGVHIVAGTGYYVAPSQDKSTVTNATVESMTNHITKELLEGACDDPSVKCGFIGEIGCCFPLYDFEKKSIQASAAGQQATGCPVSFHPGRDPESAFEVMRIFAEAGGNTKKSIMGHLERTIQDHGMLADFAAEFGSYCQFDLFGIENSYYQIKASIDFPSDAQRISLIQSLIKEKREDNILVAHDVHTKHRLEKFGGHGYKHLLTVTVPKMIAKGITQEQVDKILIHNPASILAY